LKTNRFKEKNVLQTEMPGIPKQNRTLLSIQPGKDQSQPKVAKVPMQDLMQMFDILDVGETLMKMGGRLALIQRNPGNSTQW